MCDLPRLRGTKAQLDDAGMLKGTADCEKRVSASSIRMHRIPTTRPRRRTLISCAANNNHTRCRRYRRGVKWSRTVDQRGNDVQNATTTALNGDRLYFSFSVWCIRAYRVLKENCGTGSLCVTWRVMRNGNENVFR